MLQIVRITGYRSFWHNENKKIIVKRSHKPLLRPWGRFCHPFYFFYRTGLKWHLGNDLLMQLLAHGVDRDSGGESGHRARAGRDTETKCLSRLKPGVPIHHHCPNPPHLVVNISWSVVFKRFLLYSCSSRRKTQANLVIWGVFLPILEPLEGPPSSTLGNLIFLYTLYY